MSRSTIASLNVSVSKGTRKEPVELVELSLDGIVGDAHAGPWHRQISILSEESLGRFQHKSGRPLQFGELGENITTAGMDLKQVKVHDRFVCGEVEIEVTQLGKKCHGKGCDIFNEVGECVMPVEGIFAKVIKGGKLSVGNVLMHYSAVLADA